MKNLVMFLAAVVVCLGAAAPSFADHHDKGHGEAGMPPMGPPSEMQLLDAMNGEYAVRFYYKTDPTSEEWTETEATAVLSPVVGGGAQQMVFEGEMMGMPLSGIGLTSYDRETKKWQTTWVDSMGSRVSMYTGDFKDGKMVVTGKDIGQGMTFHSRLTTYNVTEKGFEWKYEMSMDGTNYMDAAKATYTKRAGEAEPPEDECMHVQYLEIVTPDVEATCAVYAQLHGVSFSDPVPGLGNARTATLANGGKIGIRAPMHEAEEPVVRPYLLVDDIEAAIEAAQAAGGEIAHPPMEIPGHGKFAIYIQGGINHGLWQL